MTIEETREKILHDDEFVLEELKKVQVLFELKKVIRYHFEREEPIDTESVAEHVYGMHVLINYFLPLEDKNKKADIERIYLMAQFHDIDEIETGDTIGYLKTDEMRVTEREAEKRLVQKMPSTMQDTISGALNEYNEQSSYEAKFVKAIDKIEPVFHLLTENGKAMCEVLKPKREQHNSLKEIPIKPFPYIYRFHTVTENKMAELGYYSGDA